VETVARIRREHFAKGKTIKEIVRDLKVSGRMAQAQDAIHQASGYGRSRNASGLLVR
jgi:hypothetical protein